MWGRLGVHAVLEISMAMGRHEQLLLGHEDEGNRRDSKNVL